MTEEKLIQKIKELREIKPSQDWVVRVKKEIFSREPEHKINWLSVFTFVPRHKLAFATLTVIFVLVGVFGWAQSSLPGEFFYPVKKVVERAQINLSAQTERPKLQLELANKRLSDIAKIVDTNQITKLAQAVGEFQATVSEAAQDLAIAKDPKKVIQEVQKLEENRKKVEALGVMVGEMEELENVLARITEREIKDLESRTLSEEQLELLEKAKQDYEAGNYSQALETVLIISQITNSN